MISVGSMPHLSRSIHSMCTSTTSLSFTTPSRDHKVLSYNLPIVDPCVRSFDPLARFIDTINSQKLLRRVLPILTMWFPFVDDLGHTLSITTQNTRYIDHVIGIDRVNQSSEDWMHTFSSTTARLGVESTPNKCVRLYIFPSTIRPGSMPHLCRSIHIKCTSTTCWSFATPWVKTDP